MSVEMVDVISSNVKQIGFDEANEELHIIYKNSPWRYIYKKVPASMHSKLMANDSKGGFLQEYFVKPKWQFRKERL